jgi:hypothetical protein
LKLTGGKVEWVVCTVRERTKVGDFGGMGGMESLEVKHTGQGFYQKSLCTYSATSNDYQVSSGMTLKSAANPVGMEPELRKNNLNINIVKSKLRGRHCRL